MIAYEWLLISRVGKNRWNLYLYIFLHTNQKEVWIVDFYFVMQIRRSLLNEDEYGFRKAKRPIYYDEGLEVIRLHLALELDSTFLCHWNVLSFLRLCHTIFKSRGPGRP